MRVKKEVICCAATSVLLHSICSVGECCVVLCYFSRFLGGYLTRNAQCCFDAASDFRVESEKRSDKHLVNEVVPSALT